VPGDAAPAAIRHGGLRRRNTRTDARAPRPPRWRETRPGRAPRRRSGGPRRAGGTGHRAGAAGPARRRDRRRTTTATRRADRSAPPAGRPGRATGHPRPGAMLTRGGGATPRARTNRDGGTARAIPMPPAEAHPGASALASGRQTAPIAASPTAPDKDGRWTADNPASRGLRGAGGVPPSPRPPATGGSTQARPTAGAPDPTSRRHGAEPPARAVAAPHFRPARTA
jgi:hypothetical protein